jgi:catechol 2,3-dioxygenase-like lactoylglutathione lyase family enzyme
VAAQPAPRAPSGSLIGPALFVGDISKSLRFYVDGLGMKVGMEMGPPERHETILNFGGDPRNPGIILLSNRTAGNRVAIDHGHGYDRTVIRLADLETVAAHLTAAGFAPSPIHEVAMGYRMMLATDPDGYRYELVGEPKRP